MDSKFWRINFNENFLFDWFYSIKFLKLWIILNSYVGRSSKFIWFVISNEFYQKLYKIIYLIARIYIQILSAFNIT